MRLVGDWSYPTSIRFGCGRISEITAACGDVGMNKPLLVTDRGLASLPITQGTLDRLEAADLGRTIYSDFDQNPTGEDLALGLQIYRDGRHDGVIAFGGGSGLDVGKILAFMAGQTRALWDFEDIGDWWKRADPTRIHPIIAVPTTAGTGSEVGRAAVITKTDTQEKKIIFHPKMLPSVVICDPELTVGMPKPVTAGTGLDAFAHCLEAYCSPHYHPLSQGVALEGLRLVKDYLPSAYEDGTDLEARAHMMSAAIMGSTAFQKGLGAIHALSHPLGAIHHTHHGTTNAVVMPPVLLFNRDPIARLIDRAADYLEIKGGFDGFYAYVLDLNASLGIPKNLTDLGVRDPDLDALTHSALKDPSANGNPITMTYDNTRALFEACM